jgi:hypothetical protein
LPTTNIRAAAKLDTSRPYSTAFGERVKHKYEQDGKLFDSAGHQVDEDGIPGGT